MNISKISAKRVLLIIFLLTILSSGIQVSARSFLTEDEQDYINKKNAIKAVSIRRNSFTDPDSKFNNTNCEEDYNCNDYRLIA